MTPESATTVNIGSAGQRVFVVVRDEDPVTFIWTLSRDGYVGTAVPTGNVPEQDLQGSQLALTADPNLDGQTLSCLVSDGLSESLLLTWQLEVL